MIEFLPQVTALIFNGVAAIVLSLTISSLMIKINIRDVPNKRSSHTAATPKGGGIAIVVGTFYFIITTHFIISPILVIDTYSLLIPAAVVAIVGLVDDLFNVSSLIRLCVQASLAILVVGLGTTLNQISLPFVGAIELGMIGNIIAVFWIVAFMNAFNFMDGLNGLASGCTAIACAFILILAPLEGYIYYSLLGLLVSTLGFLPFNFPKGKIFLGDVGSQFMGFLIAVIALKAANSQTSYLSFYVIPLLFLPFLYDTLFTLIRRAISHENLLDAHCEHLFQLVNRLGKSHSQVSLLYYTFVILGGCGAIGMINLSEEYHLLFFIPYVVLYTAYTKITLNKAQQQGLFS